MPFLTALAGGAEFSIALPGGAAALPTILQAVYLSGNFEPPPLCAGLALCGRCRVRFVSEPPAPLPEDIKALGQALVERGWRLGCRHKAADGMKVALPEEITLLGPAAPVASAAASAAASGSPAGSDQALAVDFGSTSLHYAAVREGAATSPKIAVNPQMGAGSDIISRLAFAGRTGGLARLSALSRAALARMVDEAGGAREIVLAANPAMTCLILEKDVSGLAAAPYRLEYRGGVREDLPGLPPLWIAPLMGPFMGGDLSAGYAALAWGQGPDRPAEYPFVLADLGTNGEFILALSEHEALAASLPLGPALEGIGMSCGSEARPGVVTGFALTSDGLVPQMYGSGSPTRGLTAMPAGLSGSAYLALAAHLLRQGLVLPSGLFAEAAPASPLAARLFRALRDAGDGAGRAFYLSDTLYLSGADMEELLKIKAAFSLALRLLLQEAGMGFSGLKALYLGGALGAHVDIAALEALGFIPPGGGGKTRAAGNTSLAGAELLCRRPELRGPLAEWAAQVRVLSLTDSADFQAEYTAEMKFAW